MENEVKEYKIRKLTRKDRKTFTGLIQKLSVCLKDEHLLNLIQTGISESKDSKSEENSAVKVWTKLGVEILNNILEVLDKDCAVWFSDLLGVSVEEFDLLPLDIELDVIDQLMQCSEIESFFETALQLRNATQKLFNQSKK